LLSVQERYVPERFPGGLPFSGREYLLRLARVHGLRGEHGRQRVEEWLERLGAAGYADQSLRSMSKGMCQKMAVAQALLPSPGLLVLDEAWTGIVAAGLLIALVCLLVGSAVGALRNPPLLRHRAAAMLSTLAAIIFSLAAGVSPANAAISHTTAQSASPLAANWPGPASLLGAVCLLAVIWTVSVIAATQRDTWSIDSG
jgi:hypothetical protein